MKKITLILLAASALFFSSCNSNTETVKEVTSVPDLYFAGKDSSYYVIFPTCMTVAAPYTKCDGTQGIFGKSIPAVDSTLVMTYSQGAKLSKDSLEKMIGRIGTEKSSKSIWTSSEFPWPWLLPILYFLFFLAVLALAIWLVWQLIRFLWASRNATSNHSQTESHTAQQPACAAPTPAVASPAPVANTQPAPIVPVVVQPSIIRRTTVTRKYTHTTITEEFSS